MSRTEALSIEVAEEFCEAQEPLRTKLQSQSWRNHGGYASSETLSDEELLASAWAELPGEKRWTPVVWSAKTGRWSVCQEQRTTVRWVSLDEPKMIAQYKSGWSLQRVGVEHDCSAETVRYVLGRYNVPTRSLSEALRGDNAYGRDVRLDEASVVDIRIRHWIHGETWDALAECYGISFTACRSAGVGVSWKHVPMPAVCLEAMKRRAEPKTAEVAAVECAKPAEKPFDIELAKRLYVVERKSLKRVAKTMGCHDTKVQRELQRHGVQIRGRSEAMTVVDGSRIVDLGRQGKTVREIMRECGASDRTVRSYLARHEIPCVRPRRPETLSEATLRDLIVGRKLSLRASAKTLGVSISTVMSYVERYAIPHAGGRVSTTSEAELRALLIGRAMSLGATAKALGMSQSGVWRLVKSYGIDLRARSVGRAEVLSA